MAEHGQRSSLRQVRTLRVVRTDQEPKEPAEGTSTTNGEGFDREREVDGWWIFQYGPLSWTLDPDDNVGNVRMWQSTEEAVRFLDEFRPVGKEPA